MLPVVATAQPTSSNTSNTLSQALQDAPSGLSVKERNEANTAKLDPAVARLSASFQRAPTMRSFGESSPQAEQYVSVDIIVHQNVQQAVSQLESLGFKTVAVYGNYISGRLPVSTISKAAAIHEVKRINKVAKSTRSGSVQGQGDYAQLSRSLRKSLRKQGVDLSGKGITVGILSNSFNCSNVLNQNANYVAKFGRRDTMEDDIASGDLPGNGRIRILKEDSSSCPAFNDNSGAPRSDDEGRAMAEIIHDVAPGADIAFYTANEGIADFAQGIETLALPRNRTNAQGVAGGGAQVIVDDMGYFDEPAFQSGIVGMAIDNVVKNRGVAYFSAAGNDARGSAKINYVNNSAHFSDQTIDPSGTGNPGRPLDFDPSGTSKLYVIPIHAVRPFSDAPLWPFNLTLYWDQPIDNSGSSLQICLGDRNGKPFTVTYQGQVLPSCTDASVIGQQAIVRSQLIGSESAATLRILLLDGPAPQRVRLLTRNVVLDRFGTSDASIYGHALSPNAFAVGAGNYLDTPQCDSKLTAAKLEDFSSHGGGLMVFDNDGRPFSRAYMDNKPDLVGPDGASSVFFGAQATNSAIGFGVYNLSCRYYHAYPQQFFGTSAAAPHVAAIAALLRQAAPRATPARLYDALRKTAQGMGTPGRDNASGPGFVQPDKAYRTIGQ
ncbi:serine protease [Burkholderia metallica]|uniref:S8 family peptidase n=1 Tax=Burkholderia metallica TaxID=488729 RepID=UPI00157B7177|nr:serine protease [Burkholderia metallica]